MGIKGIFLDRDGTINELVNGEAPKDIKDFKFKNGVIEGLKKLKDYKLFIVSNQSDIATGKINKVVFLKIHEHMIEILKENGITIEKAYYCEHRKEDNCECRKPATYFFQCAIDKYDIDIKQSWMIGDKCTDVIAGEKVGLSVLWLVYWLKHFEPGMAKNFKEAVNIILKQ